MNTENKLNQYPCYFTWEWASCTKRSKLFLNDRIQTIDGTIESEEMMDNGGRNLPQLYALKGYLCTQLYSKEGGERELLNHAESCFQTALTKCGSKDDGYTKILYASMIHLFDLKDKKSNVDKYISKFHDQEPRDVAFKSNEQVLVMQGHAAGYLCKYHEAITFYEEAMAKNVTPELLFGLALAYIHRNIGKSTYSNMEKIEYLLRHAISLDSTYDLAKSKLAKHLWDSRADFKYGGNNGCHATEEIEDIIAQVESSQSYNVAILEEAATTITKIDSEKALKLYLKCYAINPKSQKTLRGLGTLHLKSWEKKKKPEDLEQAVRYYTENVEKSENAKPFDISRIGQLHRDAYLFYVKGKTRNNAKAKHHASKCKEWFEKLIDQLKKGYLDERDKAEAYYKISQYYKIFSDDPEKEKEITYLNKMLSCAMAGREDDDLQGLKFVNQAQNRLLEIAAKLDNKADCYKMKSDVFKQRKHFDSAIFYLQKAINELGFNQVSSFQLFQLKVEEIQLYIALVKKKREYLLDDGEVTMGIVRSKIDDLATDPRRSDERAQLEFDYQKLSIEKLFNDKDREHIGELRESRLVFEEKLKVEIPEKLLDDAIAEVCHDSKVVLERCMRYIRDKVYPDGKDFIYYPKHLTDLDEQKLDLVLGKIGWSNFSSNLPSLANFLVDRLDNGRHPYLLQFADVRNKGEHDFKSNQIQVLRQHCPDKESRIRLARYASCYAVEVWNKVRYEVNEKSLAEKKHYNQ